MGGGLGLPACPVMPGVCGLVAPGESGRWWERLRSRVQRVPEVGDFGRDARTVGKASAGPILPEHFAGEGPRKASVNVKVDLATSEYTHNHSVSMLEPAALLKQMPTWAEYQPAAELCGTAMFASGYIRPGEFEFYEEFVQSVLAAYTAMSALARLFGV